MSSPKKPTIETEPSQNGDAEQQAPPPPPPPPSAVQLATLAVASNLAERVPDDPVFSKSYPNLWAFLCWRDLDGKTFKDRAKLALRIERGEVIASLSDDYLAGSIAASGANVNDALKRLDRLLADPNQRWNTWRGKVPLKKTHKRQ